MIIVKYTRNEIIAYLSENNNKNNLTKKNNSELVYMYYQIVKTNDTIMIEDTDDIYYE